MYDNVDFKLSILDNLGVDFLKETPRYFDVTSEHAFENGFAICGSLKDDNAGNYKITVSNRGITIKDGSLCKYHLGNNCQTLSRSETQRAIEKLSDTLHLPIDKAKVSRIDVAQNFIVKHPTQVYYNYLGTLKNSTRSEISNGGGGVETLYYQKRLGCFVFYDKVNEIIRKRQEVPDLFDNRNVLRVERRHTSRLPETFNVECVTAQMLYDENFYIKVIDEWKSNYLNIDKINDISLNFEAMRGKKDLQKMGVLALIQMRGGKLNILNEIKTAYKMGTLTKKQEYDLRAEINEACKLSAGLTMKSDAIAELDTKVKDAVRFYR